MPPTSEGVSWRQRVSKSLGCPPEGAAPTHGVVGEGSAEGDGEKREPCDEEVQEAGPPQEGPECPAVAGTGCGRWRWAEDYPMSSRMTVGMG